MPMLCGATASGFLLAVFMSNSGGSWDNAKKYIESDHFGGRDSENDKAAIVGDTIGDPFKDTSGPSINILIKATPHNGARRFGVGFCSKRKYGKCGNTLCISHFSYCTIGAKDPPKPAAPIMRCCPLIKWARASLVKAFTIILVCNTVVLCGAAQDETAVRRG